VADCASRTVYALAPTAAGLGAKALLDALAVPLKSLLGENVQFALIERLSRKGDPASGPASAAELYLFREFLLWVARTIACAATGIALCFLARGGSPDAPRLTARLLLACAAPVSLAEFFLIRSFARANAAAAAKPAVIEEGSAFVYSRPQ